MHSNTVEQMLTSVTHVLQCKYIDSVTIDDLQLESVWLTSQMMSPMTNDEFINRRGNDICFDEQFRTLRPWSSITASVTVASDK